MRRRPLRFGSFPEQGLKRLHILFFLLLLLFQSSLCTTLLAQSTLAPPATQQSTELISLDFPPNLEIKVLIQYVSDRLGVNFLYDDQAVSQRITIFPPTQISRDSLMGLLESALKVKGLIVVDSDQPGWKKILPSTGLIAAATPSTQATEVSGRPTAAVCRVFSLRYADAQRADAVIRPFLTQPGGNSIPLNDQHLMIVTDFASTIVRVEQLLRLLDQAPPDVATKLLAIKNMDVSVLVPQLQQILTAREKTVASAEGAAVPETVEILQDTRTNQLILIGTPEKVAALGVTASSLDVPLPLETRVYTLRSASPDRLDKLVRELIDPLDAKRLYQSATDKDSGLLIVTTTVEIHRQITSLKNQLDAPAVEAASPIRFFKLTNTTAADVLATIRALEGGEDASIQPPITESKPFGASPNSSELASSSSSQSGLSAVTPFSSYNGSIPGISGGGAGIASAQDRKSVV